MSKDFIQEVKQDIYYKREDITVPASGNTELGVVTVGNDETIYCSINVTGQALDGFIISVRAHQDDSFQTLFSTSSHYTTPAGPMKATSSDLTSLSAGSNGFFLMDCRGFWQVKIEASAASNSATVSIYVHGS